MGDRTRSSVRAARRFVLGAVAGCVGACGGNPAGADGASTSTIADAETTLDAGSETAADRPAGTFSLVATDGWQLDDDPPSMLAADRPDPVACTLGWGVEDGVFEFDSALCNWGAFVQPSLVPIEQGDTIEIIVLHDTLYSEDPQAVAHLAVVVGDALAWETTLMIPAPPGLVRPSIVAATDAPAGTPVHWHVHNHGYNNYRLVDIKVTPP